MTFVFEPPGLDDAAFVEWLYEQPADAEFETNTRSRVYRLEAGHSGYYLSDMHWSILVRFTPRQYSERIALAIPRRIAEKLEQ